MRALCPPWPHTIQHSPPPPHQFYSDLTLLDPITGDVLLSKKISVNDPFRYQGVTMYQVRPW